MNNKLLNFILFLVISCVFINCANRGTPQGGEKDILPPEITSTSPKNYSTNFKGKEIKIYFNEYIKLKNLQKQLIISPPMKTQPEILPLGGASKSITIKIFDTLQPNTTYAINFGNSIEDNNEGNPYTYYRYVFSTGDYIDSLSVKGNIVDAFNRKTETFVSVMLYEVDSTFHDSIVYRKTPKYITNTLDSVTNFSIDNVKAGKYLLVALKDNNTDNKFQQKKDQIGFHSEFIDVPTDTLYTLKLFNETINFKGSRPRLVAGEKIQFGYEGEYDDVNITLKSDVPDNFEYRITKDETTDTLYYWYKPKLEADSLVFNISKNLFDKDYTVRLKDNKKDSLIISATPQGSINYTEDFNITGSIPFINFDNSKFKIVDQDTIPVAFTSKFDSISNTYNINFDKTENNNYSITALPEAFTDFFENTNDTLNFNVSTQPKDSYGNLRLRVGNAVYPIIVQLTDEKGIVKLEQYATEQKPLDFLNISPGKYYVRVIFDSNKNGTYDTGNYLKRIQPEIVKHSEKEIEQVRAGWDNEVEFILK